MQMMTSISQTRVVENHVPGPVVEILEALGSLVGLLRLVRRTQPVESYREGHLFLQTLEGQSLVETQEPVLRRQVLVPSSQLAGLGPQVWRCPGRSPEWLYLKHPHPPV